MYTELKHTTSVASFKGKGNVSTCTSDIDARNIPLLVHRLSTFKLKFEYINYIYMSAYTCNPLYPD